MVDAEERLTALKKAYAEIILNTAKEAAARIMQSERKALRVQHELNASKEQALQIVLRLKRMMDSKVTEAAEMAYLSQHKRIGELEGRLRDAENRIREAEDISLTQQRKAELLEAQLQEAEDIVNDLRTELREVQDELERVRNENSRDIVNDLRTELREVQDELERVRNEKSRDIVNDLRTELREVQDELERVRNEKSRDIGECGTGTQVQASEDISHSSQSHMYPPQTISSLAAPLVNNSSLQQINEAYEGNEGNDNVPESCSGRKSDILSVPEEHRPNTSQPSYVSPPELLNVSAMKYPGLNQKTQTHPLHGENSLAKRPKIPSAVLTTKEAEPYRNRRTQRIRAFEEKLMAGELSFSDTVATTYEITGREGEGIHRAPVQKSGNMCITDEKDEGEADNPKEKVDKANHVKQRKRKSKLRNLSNVLERDQTSSIMSTEGKLININGTCGGNPSKTLPKVSVDTEDHREISRAAKRRKIRETDKVSMSKQLPVTPQNGGIIPNKRDIEKEELKSSPSKMKNVKSVRRKWRKCKRTSRILLVATDQTPDTTSTETNPEENSAQRVDEDSNTVRNQPILLRCIKHTVNDAAVVQGSSALNTTNSGQASVSKSVPVTSESGCIEGSVIPTNPTDTETPGDHPTLSSEKKASDAGDNVSHRPATERVFKYTFQRKRKRNNLSGSNCHVSLETNILKGKTAEKQNVTVEMKNPTSTTEPSPQSCRVAEVARQLISLSEKKW